MVCVGEGVVRRTVTIVGEKKRLDHRLIDYRGNEGERERERVHASLVQ